MRKIVLLVLALIICLLSSEFCISAPAKKPASKSVSKKGNNKAVDKAKDKANDKVVDKEIVKEKQKSRSEIKYAGFDRDPFLPPAIVVKMLEKPENLFSEGDAQVKLPKIELQGIIWSKNIPQVIVNGGVMKVGEFIEEFEIKEIQRNGIVLFFKGNDYFIKMIAYAPKGVKKKKR